MKTISFEECSKLKVDLALRSGSLGDVLVELVLRMIKQESKWH